MGQCACSRESEPKERDGKEATEESRFPFEAAPEEPESRSVDKACEGDQLGIEVDPDHRDAHQEVGGWSELGELTIGEEAHTEREERKNFDPASNSQRDALQMLEAGASKVFGWVFVDSNGHEYETREAMVAARQEQRVKKGKRKQSSSNMKKARFEQFSTVLSPREISWDTPIHYICYHVFPDVTPDKVFQAMHDIATRATWEKEWKDSKTLACLSDPVDIVYSRFPNDSRILRAMGLNYDFVDKRTVYCCPPFPQSSDVLPAYAMAWKASRQPEKPINYALRTGSFRFQTSPRSSSQVGDFSEKYDVAARRGTTQTSGLNDQKSDSFGFVHLQRVQATPPAEYVVVLSPLEDDAGFPHQKSFRRCKSMPPSGYIIRGWDTRLPDPSTCIFPPISDDTPRGVRLTVISRSNISLPVNALSRNRLHVKIVENFRDWRTALESSLYQ